MRRPALNDPSRRAVRRIGLVGVLIALGTACAGAGGNAPRGDATALREEIRVRVGDAACTEQAQCRTLALGHKACGGPEAYVAWSTMRTDEGQLQALAKRYADARQADAEKSGRVSDCSMRVDPGAQCVAKRCVLRDKGRPE